MENMKFDYGDVDIIWNFINQNYISRDKVRGLRMKEKSIKIFDLEDIENVNEGFNEAVCEINKKIEEVLK